MRRIASGRVFTILIPLSHFPSRGKRFIERSFTPSYPHGALNYLPFLREGELGDRLPNNLSIDYGKPCKSIMGIRGAMRRPSFDRVLPYVIARSVSDEAIYAHSGGTM